jgi:hypothetical protein
MYRNRDKKDPIGKLQRGPKLKPKPKLKAGKRARTKSEGCYLPSKKLA